MDPLHAKAGADLLSRSRSTEDEFYHRHSCERLVIIRSMFFKTSNLRPQKDVEPIGNPHPHEL